MKTALCITSKKVFRLAAFIEVFVFLVIFIFCLLFFPEPDFGTRMGQAVMVAGISAAALCAHLGFFFFIFQDLLETFDQLEKEEKKQQ